MPKVKTFKSENALRKQEQNKFYKPNLPKTTPHIKEQVGITNNGCELYANESRMKFSDFITKIIPYQSVQKICLTRINVKDCLDKRREKYPKVMLPRLTDFRLQMTLGRTTKKVVEFAKNINPEEFLFFIPSGDIDWKFMSSVMSKTVNLYLNGAAILCVSPQEESITIAFTSRMRTIIENIGQSIKKLVVGYEDLPFAPFPGDNAFYKGLTELSVNRCKFVKPPKKKVKRSSNISGYVSSQSSQKQKPKSPSFLQIYNSLGQETSNLSYRSSQLSQTAKPQKVKVEGEGSSQFPHTPEAQKVKVDVEGEPSFQLSQTTKQHKVKVEAEGPSSNSSCEMSPLSQTPKHTDFLYRCTNLVSLSWNGLEDKRLNLGRDLRCQPTLQKLALTEAMIIANPCPATLYKFHFPMMETLILFNVAWDGAEKFIGKTFPNLKSITWCGPYHGPSSKILKAVLDLNHISEIQMWCCKRDEYDKEMEQFLETVGIPSDVQHFKLNKSRNGSWMGTMRHEFNYEVMKFEQLNMIQFFERVEDQNAFESLMN